MLPSKTYWAYCKVKPPDQDLFLPKDYSGSPTVSLYTPWTEAEVPSYLAAGSGSDAITDLNLQYLYGPEAESSGKWDRYCDMFLYISIALWHNKDHKIGYYPRNLTQSGYQTYRSNSRSTTAFIGAARREGT